MEYNKLYDLYDNVNTTACRWLQYNRKAANLPLGIKQLGRKNIIHQWLLKQLLFVSVYNQYEPIYIQGSFIDYIYLRYFQGIKQLRWATKHNKDKVYLIDAAIFCDELIEAFNRTNEQQINSKTFEDIYDVYYGGK